MAASSQPTLGSAQGPRRWRGLAVLCCLLGCSREGGLIVAVTRDPATTGPIDALTFYVGVSRTGGPPFLRDGAVPADVTLGGRDIADDPYRLLLHDRRGVDEPGSVVVAVLGQSGGQTVAFGGFDQPQAFMPDQLILRTVVLDGASQGNVKETGCVTWRPEGGPRQVVSVDADEDCDGYRGDVDDCNDSHPGVHPGATEVCGNMQDEDCDMMIDESEDVDMDGVTTCAGDCADDDPEVNPGKAERCDGKDNDCDEMCDNAPEIDRDGDLYTACGSHIVTMGTACEGAPPDCNDDPNRGGAMIFPGAAEVCNGLDDDCDGMCDEPGAMTWDMDGDGFTTCGSQRVNAGAMCVMWSHDDCRDDLPNVNPGAREICDGVDDNCDGSGADDQQLCYGNTVMSACGVGAAACRDSGSPPYLGACGPAGFSTAVPGALCTAYEACLVMGDLDPWTCANEASADKVVDCTLYHDASGNLCTPTQVGLAILPFPMLTMCSWTILGGTDQTHYVVGLSPEAAAVPMATLTACPGFFTVLGKKDDPPQPDGIPILLVDQYGTPHLVLVRITPVLAGVVCPALGPGLVCMLRP